MSVLWLSALYTVADFSRLLEVKSLLVVKLLPGARLLPEVPPLLALTSDHAVSPTRIPSSRR